MKTLVSALVLIANIIIYQSFSQIDVNDILYRNFINPESLSFIDSLDLFPQIYSEGIGCGKAGTDEDPGYYIIAEDFIPGYINHIWLQYHDLPDSSLIIKLKIDDKTIISAPFFEFFQNGNYSSRFPFKQSTSGAMVCDIQMPYQKSFKLLAKFTNGIGCNLFWEVGWKNIPSEMIKEPYSIFPESKYTDNQFSAESALKRGFPIYPEKADLLFFEKPLNPGESFNIADIHQSGVITGIYLKINDMSVQVLMNTMIKMTWDNASMPDVNVPIADLFGCGEGNNNFTSFFIRSYTSLEWLFQFPLPFKRSAEIKIINNSNKSNSFKGYIAFLPKPIDIKKYGYFKIDYNVSNPLQYKVYHKIASQKGRGKFAGLFMFINGNNNYPSFLEGNPQFDIDSNKKYFIKYEGTEDYFNGGWYFFDGPFNTNYYGCLNLWSQMYRYHILDPFDFTKSFDAYWEHGVRNDFICNCRTLAFMYVQKNNFSFDKDTVMIGDEININGSGFQENEEIFCKICGRPAFQIRCDKFGCFNHKYRVPQDFPNGFTNIEVNSEINPKPLNIIDLPQITVIKPPYPEKLRCADSIIIAGQGFRDNESICIQIGSIPAANIITGVKNSFYIKTTIPEMSEGKYEISAVGTMGSRACSNDSLEITDEIDYEFEKMRPIFCDADNSLYYFGFWIWDEWSYQYGYTFQPCSIGRKIIFEFNVPKSGIYDTKLFASIGGSFGIYDILIDSKQIISYDFFRDSLSQTLYRIGPISLGEHYFTVGNHTIEFSLKGYNSKSTGLTLTLDNFLIKPIKLDEHSKDSISGDLGFSIFPHPVSRTDKYSYLQIEKNFTGIVFAQVDIFDINGNYVKNQFNGYISKNNFNIFLGDLAPGVYLAVLKVTQNSYINKAYRVIVITE